MAKGKLTDEEVLEAYVAWEEMKEIEEAMRIRIENAFIPGSPQFVPFEEQITFFSDTSLQKLARCGNRAAKTFSCMRDLAWKIMRNHPYRKDYNCSYQGLTYLDTKKQRNKTMWAIGPSYDFVMDTMWNMYLKEFIPTWYYTDDEGAEMIDYVQNDRHKIAKITFRNGDKLEFKSYSQSDLAIMGRKVDEVYLDEMPPRAMIISELITRTLDNDGSTTCGFTPLVENEEVRKYLDDKVEAGIMSLHSWSLTANPLYRDNPERLKRALDEWSHLPPGERAARLNGEWYYETRFGKVFADCVFHTIDDFPIPPEWRRVRVVDPAAHISGCAFFAEDPDTGTWYGYLSTQLGNKVLGVDGDKIASQVDKLDKNPFIKSIYDNAEAWFGASDLARKMGFQPCIQKNVDAAIMTTKKTLNNKVLILFNAGFSTGIKQLRDAEWGPNGKVKTRHKYHALDCLYYFCREIPPKLTEKQKRKIPTCEQEKALVTLQSKLLGDADGKKKSTFFGAATSVFTQPAGKRNLPLKRRSRGRR